MSSLFVSILGLQARHLVFVLTLIGCVVSFNR